MTDDRIASLSSLDSWWGSFLIVSTVIVLIGVAAEALQFMKCVNQRPRLKHSLELGAFLVLIVGTAGELLGESKTISVGDRLYGLLNDKAGSANERAGKADDRAASAEKYAAKSNERARALEKEAEELRAKNLALEKEVAPRRINPDECASRIQESFKHTADLVVRVSSYSPDIESGILAWQIGACLVRAKIGLDFEAASIFPTGGFGVGVFVTGTDESLVSAIKAELERSNVRVLDGTGIFPQNQVTLHPGAPPNPAANVVVGIKPPIDMP